MTILQAANTSGLLQYVPSIGGNMDQVCDTVYSSRNSTCRKVLAYLNRRTDWNYFLTNDPIYYLDKSQLQYLDEAEM